MQRWGDRRKRASFSNRTECTGRINGLIRTRWYEGANISRPRRRGPREVLNVEIYFGNSDSSLGWAGPWADRLPALSGEHHRRTAARGRNGDAGDGLLRRHPQHEVQAAVAPAPASTSSGTGRAGRSCQRRACGSGRLCAGTPSTSAPSTAGSTRSCCHRPARSPRPPTLTPTGTATRRAPA